MNGQFGNDLVEGFCNSTLVLLGVTVLAAPLEYKHQYLDPADKDPNTSWAFGKLEKETSDLMRNSFALV